jgi:hypothetical protein
MEFTATFGLDQVLKLLLKNFVRGCFLRDVKYIDKGAWDKVFRAGSPYQAVVTITGLLFLGLINA